MSHRPVPDSESSTPFAIVCSNVKNCERWRQRRNVTADPSPSSKSTGQNSSSFFVLGCDFKKAFFRRRWNVETSAHNVQIKKPLNSGITLENYDKIMTDKMECARSQNIPWKRSKTEKGLKKCRKFFFFVVVERRENFFSQFRNFSCRNFDVEKSLSFPDGICSLCVMAVQRFEFWFSYHLVARQRKKRR